MGSAVSGAVPYPRHAVSTRKLIVVALLCGLAILVAGGIQLFRIADTDDRTVEVLAEGEPATVGSVTVVVEASERDPSRTTVTVAFRLAVPEREPTTVPLSGFTLLVGGDLERPVDPGDATSACPASIPVGAETTRCEVDFPGGSGTATIGFSLDGDQALWRLDPEVT